MNQTVILSPFTRLKIRAIAFLCSLILAVVLISITVASVVDWCITQAEKFLK